MRDALCQHFFCAPRPIDTFVQDLSRMCNGAVHAFPSFVEGGRNKALLSISARFQFRKIAFHQPHSGLRFLFQRFSCGKDVVVPGLKRFHEYF